jgi:ParB-like chromosome segregation protein Spo0J
MTETRPYGELKLTSEDFQNPRILNRSGLSKKDLRELALDIARRGLLYPLLVDADGLIIGGQRRYLAIGLILTEEGCLLGHVDEHDAYALAARCREFQRDGIPVRRIEGDLDAAATALADNLHRADLSSFEVAERLAAFNSDEGGPTGAELARRIGKSKTYVSRMLKAWRGASPALKRAWSAGTIAYDTVKQIAELPTAEQPAAVARAERALERAKPGPKGSHGRPGVAALKAAHERLVDLCDRDDDHGLPEDYLVGVRDALDFATGGKPHADLAVLIGQAAPSPE